MSYCVNCGVKLDSSLHTCPLCHTPVINPNAIRMQYELQTGSPYPNQKGKIEPVNRKDIIIFSTASLLAIAICCGLLNFLFFPRIPWSIPVIGLCFVLWILLLPVTLLPSITGYFITLLDIAALGSYVYMITYLTPTDTWYYKVALPLTLICFLLLELLVFLVKNVPFNFFVGLLYFSIGTGLICVSIELLLDNVFQTGFSLSWSAVVLAVCSILSIILITVLSLRRMRNMLQKRFHI